METVKLAKLAATLCADEALDRMVKTTNDGFTAGRLTKTELLSWVILQFEKQSFSRSIEKIREAHFDQVAYLKNVVKEMEAARRSGQETPTVDLASLLAPLAGGKTALPKKKAQTIASELERELAEDVAAS